MPRFRQEDTLSYEEKVAKTLKVYSAIEDAWRQGKISVFTLNELSDILDEYTDLIEETV